MVRQCIILLSHESNYRWVLFKQQISSSEWKKAEEAEKKAISQFYDWIGEWASEQSKWANKWMYVYLVTCGQMNEQTIMKYKNKMRRWLEVTVQWYNKQQFNRVEYKVVCGSKFTR